MLRIRLASLALAFGLLSTLAGCATYRDGPMFPRVSSFFSRFHREPDCECQTGSFAPPPGVEVGHGPVLVPPGQPPLPAVTTVPANQPPTFKTPPSAPAFPYVPAN